MDTPTPILHLLARFGVLRTLALKWNFQLLVLRKASMDEFFGSILPEATPYFVLGRNIPADATLTAHKQERTTKDYWKQCVTLCVKIWVREPTDGA